MRRLVSFLLILLLVSPFMMSFTYKPFQETQTIHEEKNFLISETKNIRSSELQDSKLRALKQFYKDRDIVATVVYNEAGIGCSDRHMELVAAVIYNRLNSSLFPNNIYDIVTAPRQYLPAYADPSSYYGRRARESSKWKKCQEIATRALSGMIDCPDNVFFQANFTQGTGIYEIHETSYSTTWFCFGGQG